MKRTKVACLYRIEEYLYDFGYWRAYRTLQTKDEAIRLVDKMGELGWALKHVRVTMVETYEKVIY